MMLVSLDIHDIGLYSYIYDVDYTCYDVIWVRDISYGLFSSCLVYVGKGLHMSIELVYLDWIISIVLVWFDKVKS